MVVVKLSNSYGKKTLSDIEINRGIELLLNGGKQKEQPKPKPETFKVVLDKTVSFLRREIKFYFKVSLNLSKIEE